MGIVSQPSLGLILLSVIYCGKCGTDGGSAGNDTVTLLQCLERKLAALEKNVELQYGFKKRWVKLNGISEVCFESRGNKPGTFTPGAIGFLAGVKLVHRSGKVRCGGGAFSDSNWGCKGFKSSIGTVITNGNNSTRFPLTGVKWVDSAKTGRWYSKDGFNSNSPSLVLQRGFNDPFYISRDSTLSVWYGEDLVDSSESDNHGRVCVDVYGYFI